MSRHIINKQVLEVHLPRNADVHAVQKDVSRLYHEKLVPVINDLCERHSPGGTRCKIETLTIDLGKVQLEDVETVFAQKFAAAIAAEEVMDLPATGGGTDRDVQQKTPLEALAWYLKTGTLPWWAGPVRKDYLHQLLDELNGAPGALYKALLRQVGHHPRYLQRFLHTFSEAQIHRCFQSLMLLSPDDLSDLRQGLADFALSHPGRFSPGLTSRKIAHAFWTAAFRQAALGAGGSALGSGLLHDTLLRLGADWPQVRKAVREKQPAGIGKWIGPERSAGTDVLPALRRRIDDMARQQPDNPVWQAFFRQVARMLAHPRLAQLPSREVQLLDQLLRELEAAQSKSAKEWAEEEQRDQTEQLAGTKEAGEALRALSGGLPGWQAGKARSARVPEAATEANLGPLSKHLHRLGALLRQLEPAPAADVIEQLSAAFSDTDCLAVQNAGLVILWPFLQRFFKNLELLGEQGFRDEASKNKAACALQYLADDAEEELFEGQLSLNKVLCGIPLEAPVEPVLLSAGEKEIAEGLLQAVIARGPYWKNLSVQGFRSSYLQREGLLRPRDGRWLLQVKKETHDITLEKLPWSFGVVKLPWVEVPLIVEWT